MRLKFIGLFLIAVTIAALGGYALAQGTGDNTWDTAGCTAAPDQTLHCSFFEDVTSIGRDGSVVILPSRAVFSLTCNRVAVGDDWRHDCAIDVDYLADPHNTGRARR